ncbi:hypothetical protein PGB90_002197 [Kerria lacca]
MCTTMMPHIKCRNTSYPDKLTNVKRMEVPEDKVKWDVIWSSYNPSEFTSPFIKGKVWADPEIGDENFKPCWNMMDGNINRLSYCGYYKIINGYPINPIGRTGLKGRGLLGRWGPNHAVDPIVTRWKNNNESVECNEETGKPILQFVAIRRRDSGEWALPGGMVDVGEKVSATLKREFLEEALNIDEKSEDEKLELKEKIEKIFRNGAQVYAGYMDDPRNTDNAWIETVAVHFHDEKNEHFGSLALNAGDDAESVQWMDIDKNVNLYASHYMLINEVVNKLNAHW